MKKAIKYSLLGIGLILSAFLFIPKTYDVPAHQKSNEIKYWNLSDGSKIGYFYFDGKNKNQHSPIIYLHGGPGGFISPEIIEDIKPFSTLGHDVYLYDQIGSGHSDRLSDINQYSAIRHKNDLVEIVDKINSDRVILIGQSWGALLACLYISENPEKVEKVIFTGPGPILPIDGNLRNTKAPDSLNLKAPYFSNKEGNEKAYNFRMKVASKLAFAFGVKITSDKEADSFFTYLNSELNKSTVCDTSINITSYGGGGYYSHIMTVKSLSSVENKKDEIRKANIPALILKGQCDNQKWGYTEEYFKLFPDHQFKLIQNAGHAITREAPDEYYKAITNFLKQ